MRLLYSTGVSFYYLFLRIAAIFSEKAREWHYGRKDIFPKLEEVFHAHHACEDPAPVAWFHCASLGEFEQGKPVIEAYKALYPGHLILLTFFSPSGFRYSGKNNPADHIFYLPMDTLSNSRRFIDIVRPSVAVFVKYEFWFNYLHFLFQKEVPVFTISAIFRPDQHFFKWYGGWFRTHLRKINMIFVQDDESAELLRMVDVSNLLVAGDTRFDRVAAVKAFQQPFPLIDAFVSGRHVVVAGSTWPADEELISALYKQTGDRVKLIIAPHEIGESRIKELAAKFGDKSVIYSEAPGTNLASRDVLIIDSIGMLSQLYRFASVAYIGGGFGVGIHNTLEAAAYGVPVFFGPNYQRFREARDLVACGAAISVNNSRDFTDRITLLLSDQSALEDSAAKAGKYVKERTGATSAIINNIAQQLSNIVH